MVLMSRLDAYILRYGDYCAHNNYNYMYNNQSSLSDVWTLGVRVWVRL